MFLKLTSMIINKNHIHKIIILPNKYCIHMNYNQLSDNFLFAYIDFNIIKIEICEKKNEIDYKKISDFIKSI